jgi:hypothetical protein
MAEQRASRDELRKAQVGALHRAIGEFAVAFETISHQQYRCIEVLLKGAGLRDERVVQILFADYTSEPMRAMLQSLIGQLRPTNASEQAIVKNLLVRHQKLISRRNEVMHGTWMIGQGSAQTTDWGTAFGWKLGKNKKGASVKGFEYRVEDFNEMTREANELVRAFFRLYGCYSGKFDVAKNFDVDDDGAVAAPK